MNTGQDKLQEKLEALEAGEPLDVCVVGLDEEEATLLHLAAQLQQVPVPARDAAQLAAQRASLMEKVQIMEAENTQTSESKIGKIWASLRSWAQNADTYDWAVVGAMAPAVVILVVAIISALMTTPTTSSQPTVAEDESNQHTAASTEMSEESIAAETVEESIPVAETAETETAVSTATDAVTFGPQYAALNNLNGVVHIQTSTGDWQIATADMLLQAGQRIQTGSFSSATLTFYDGSVATMGPDSELWIDALNANPEGIRTIAFTQWSGITEHQVAHVTTEGSRYEVRTPTAVSSAKGTEFTVMMTDDLRTRVNVDEGAVEVTGQESSVLTVAGQTTAVDAGEEPTEPTYTVTGEGEVNEIGATWIIAGQPFLTDGNTIIIGNPQVGDIVYVKGHLDEAGATVADVIGLLRPEVENSFTLNGIVDAMGDAWTVSGKAIATDENTVIAEGIELGSDVIVTGLILEDGTFLAQEIALNTDEDRFEFSGVAQTIGADEWTISGVTIAVDADTAIEADIVEGDTVKVEGVILEEGTWLATEIKADEPEASPFEFTGIVDGIDPWMVAGIDLTTNDWTEIEEGIAVGDRVKVEGVIQTDGTWLANEIKLADDELDTAVIEFIGTVESTEPWIVNGIALTTDENSQIGEGIEIGTAVQVTAQILPDGSLLILNMQPITEFGDGCLGYTSLVMIVGDGQITLLDGSTIALTADIVISGELVPGAVVMILTCTDADGVQTVTSIIVLYVLDTPPVIEPAPEPPAPAPEPPPAQPAAKVTLCHNASKNNPHTITVDQAAVNAHIGHGDTMGACP